MLVEEILQPAEESVADGHQVMLQDGPVRIVIPADSQLDLEESPSNELAPLPEDPPPEVGRPSGWLQIDQLDAGLLHLGGHH